MATIETWFDQDLKNAVKVRYLDGNVFSQDNNGNVIGVNVYNNGEPATIGGSVSASIIRADGATVAVTGTISDNKASVILPQAAYAIPGAISIVLKLTNGSDTTTLLAVVSNVYLSSTDSIVDPGTIVPSIAELIEAVENAVESIPADYSALSNGFDVATGANTLIWQSGGMYEATGIEYSGDTRARTGFISVSPGEDIIIYNKRYASLNVTVFEFASNETTTTGVNERLRIGRANDKENYYKVGSGANYIRLQINEAVSIAQTEVFVFDKVSMIEKVEKIYDSVSAMKSDKELTPGMYAKTLGFSADGDLGGGLYKIEEGLTANNISVFALDNGYFANRVFDDSPVFLESVNIGNYATATINPILEANNVHVVKCGRLTVSNALVLGDYDFEFDIITYTGNDFAIVADSMQNHRIVGNEIVSTDAGGVLIRTTTGHFRNNDIDIRKITAEKSAVEIFPINGKGILHNTYRFAEIECKEYGILTRIFANTGKYSYQGEEFFEVGNIQASNDDHNGTAVYFLIDPVDNMSKDGTITGITFSHLGVENSDIGVKLYCGSNVNPNTPEACIKSIFINDMRCRETSWTDVFLNAAGYIKELYVKPTSAIKPSQWLMNITSRDVTSVIDGYIITNNPYSPVGYGLRAVRGIKYFERTTESPLTITGDTDFLEIQTDEDNTDLYLSPLLIIDESTRGTTITIRMDFYYLESAQNIMFKLPKATEQGAVSVELIFPHHTSGDPYPVLTNLDTENDHYFSVSCLVDHDTVAMNNIYIVRDLGNA